MKVFLSKYKWAIILTSTFFVIVLFLAPGQSDYYLENDIKAFKKYYLVPILLWTSIVASIAIFVLAFIKAKSLKRSTTAFLFASVAIAFFLFIFQDVFLGASLFLNRQVKRDTLEKTYVANYLAGPGQTKENFFPYEVSTQQFTTDKKLINKLYSPALKQNDTLKMRFDKGLLGIAFQQKSLPDK